MLQLFWFHDAMAAGSEVDPMEYAQALDAQPGDDDLASSDPLQIASVPPLDAPAEARLIWRPPQRRGRGRPRKDRPRLAVAPAQLLLEATDDVAVSSTLAENFGGTEQLVAEPPSKRARKELVSLTRPKVAGAGPGTMAALHARSSLGTALVTAAQLAGTRDELVDEQAGKVARSMLSARGHIQSGQAHADVLGVDPTKVADNQRRTASAMVASSRAARAALEQGIIDNLPACDRLFYFDWAAHDETPLSINVRSGVLSEARKPTAPDSDEVSVTALATLTSTSELSRTAGNVRNFTLSSAGSPQKIVQSMNKGLMVIRVLGELISIVTQTVCPLSVVEANTAACALDAQLRVSGSTANWKNFAMSARGATTDRGPENRPCERGVAAKYGGLAKLLHIFCEVHMSAGVHKKMFAMRGLDNVVTGAIRTSLSLRSGSSMMRFRVALREEVTSRLQVLSGIAPHDAQRHRYNCMTMFMQRGAHMEKRRLLMALVPNGDWRHSKVQYYKDPNGFGPQRDEDVVEHVVLGLLAALAASSPPVYARHRWTGADIATDWLGLLEACHRLGSSTYMRFAASYSSGAMRASLLLCGERLSHYDTASLSELADADNDVSPHGGVDAPAAPNNPGEIDWAKVNAEDRRHGVKFWASKPMGCLVRQRLVLEPMRCYLQLQFELSSEAFEHRQLCNLAKALARGRQASVRGCSDPQWVLKADWTRLF